jgi:hypothetical protein
LLTASYLHMVLNSISPGPRSVVSHGAGSAAERVEPEPRTAQRHTVGPADDQFGAFLTAAFKSGVKFKGGVPWRIIHFRTAD